MAERRDKPNSKSRDYQVKSSQIDALGLATDPLKIDSTLMDLGRTLQSNDLLSNSQRDYLLGALHQTRLLQYRANYLSQAEKLELADDGIEPKEVQRRLQLDAIHWDIETNPRLQVAAVIAATRLSDDSPTIENPILIVSTLLNTAHLATKPAFNLITNFQGESINRGIAKFVAIENEVFGKRVEYGNRLASLHLAEPIELEDLEELDLESFRQLRNSGDFYDPLLGTHFVSGFKAQTVSQRFKELQTVLHSGFAMGVRDAMVFDTREFPEE